MIVECKNCNTRFRIGDDKVTVKGVKVRCSKCQHTFIVRKPAEPVVTAPGQAEKTQVAAASPLLAGPAKTMQLFAVQPADIRTGQQAAQFDLDAPIKTDPFSVPDTRSNQAGSDPGIAVAPTNPLGPVAPSNSSSEVGTVQEKNPFFGSEDGGSGGPDKASVSVDPFEARRELFGSASQWSAEDADSGATPVESPPDPFSFAPPPPQPSPPDVSVGTEDSVVGTGTGAADLFANPAADASVGNSPFSAAPPAEGGDVETRPMASPALGADPFAAPEGGTPEATDPFAALGMAPQPGAALQPPGQAAPPGGDPFAAFAQNPPTAPTAEVGKDPFSAPPGPGAGADPLAPPPGGGEPASSQDMFASLGLAPASSGDAGLPFEGDDPQSFDGSGMDQETRVRQVDDNMLKMLATYSEAEQKSDQGEGSPEAAAPEPGAREAEEGGASTDSGLPHSPLTQVAQAAAGLAVALGLLVGIYAFRGGEFGDLSIGRFFRVVIYGTQGLVDDQLTARKVFVSYYSVDRDHRLIVVSGVVENHGESALPGVKIRAWILGDDGAILTKSEAYAGATVDPFDLAQNKTAQAANRLLARKAAKLAGKLEVGATWPFAVVLDAGEAALRSRDVKLDMRGSDRPVVVRGAGKDPLMGTRGATGSTGTGGDSDGEAMETAQERSAAIGNKKKPTKKKKAHPNSRSRKAASRRRKQKKSPQQPNFAPPPPPPPPPPGP